ncbi:fluoroquinolone transport system permease protein [Natranaerovirga pectinivora]|uniref:Fluoroquinolone transport system permease protein n=1 Tax=Natranaerovirga pectinivora TaxID=682400 RepID=A0A4R3MM53_9FIRM|nr:hypothetical protein [Natranaerovirga pectinivora]TCT15373.1 fluoroquinolone transport system permease protein [Natranaerovirga pectinivora]
MKSTSFKADMKMIVREPMLILFMIMPLFIYIIFKLIISFGEPLFLDLGVDLYDYYVYILGLSFLMAPMTLGTVAGFLMIDEKDARIYELISITPVGYFNYMVNRLLLPVVGCFLYTFIAYYILNIYDISQGLLLFIALLTSINSIIMGLLLFSLADNKVKGLTYSKGFSMFNILALADILNNKWFAIIAAVSPFYWVVRIIKFNDFSTVLMAIGVHLVWLFSIIRYSSTRNQS